LPFHLTDDGDRGMATLTHNIYKQAAQPEHKARMIDTPGVVAAPSLYNKNALECAQVRVYKSQKSNYYYCFLPVRRKMLFENFDRILFLF